MISSVENQHDSCKQKTLKSVVYREFLRKAMVPILFVEVALIFFYFISVSYMTDRTVDVMAQTAKQSLINLSDLETRYIDKRLKYIRRKTHELHEKFQTGLDTSFDVFASETLPTDLPWGSGALILKPEGDILIGSQAFHRLIDESVMGDAYSDISQPYVKHDFLKGQTPIDQALQGFITGQLHSKEFEVSNEHYFVTQNKIEESGWRLIILTHMKSIYEPIYAQKAESQNLGYFVILLIINFYIVFFIYLLVASQRFAKRITQPIEKISQFISHINQRNTEDAPVSYVKIKELDTLIDLNVEIQEAKQRYMQINTEMSHKNKQLERLAVTDTLTQAYNRLKLDEVLCYEIARARRDENALSTILLDIDNFKDVNDTYGHQSGDSVLISMVQILQRNIRRTDILGRWGGEEFLLILPNTNLDNAAIQAEKLRRLVERTEFGVVGNITISLGVSSCIDNCTERLLIELADKALYKAKEAGRNCVKTQEMPTPVKLELVKFLDERSALSK